MTLHRYMLNRRLAAATPLSGRVLEIGNGRRRRGLDTGATVTLDLSAARAPHVQADALRLPFADGTFDGVVCCETLQYVPRFREALTEIRRVLKLGGVLIASFPDLLSRQADEPYVCERWQEYVAEADVHHAGFVVWNMRPLWPPLYAWTSGWFVEARAA